MKLVILTAVLAVCGAARIDRSYVPSLSSRTAATLEGSSKDGVPTGGYTNDALGVVVDAVAPGTRTSGAEPTGLGGPRTSYGSTDSKVGDAAFRVSLTGFDSSSGANTRIAPGFETITGEKENTGGSTTRIAPGFESILAYGSDNDKAHANTLKFSNEIGLDKYSYGFETDNGIAIGENGVAEGGVNANGGYSYKGEDGKVYSVSYTADKNGYKPQGSHLPTPPPIPKEILVSLKKNAEEEAAGVVDDGSYDAQKYNNEGDNTSNNPGKIGTSFVSHSSQVNNPVSSTGLPTGNSAYSSAVTTGSGSASAYAGSGPSQTDLKNQFTHTYGLNSQGASGSSVSVPSSASASASVSGKETNLEPNNFPTRFGENQNTFGQVNGANTQSQTQSTTQTVQQTSQAGSVLQSQTGQYKPQASQSSFSQIGSNNANFVNSGQYYHNRQPNVPVGTVSKPGYSNAPVVTTVSPIASTQSGQYQGTTTSSNYNGLTQAAVSPFTVVSSTPSTQAQFGFSGSQQAVTQVGQTPTVPSQSGHSQTDTTNTQSQQGTIYEYNKPASVNQQTVTQFGSSGSQQAVTLVGQTPIVPSQSGHSQTDTTNTQSQQGTIYEYNKPASVNQQTVTQFGSKPIVQSQTGFIQTDNSQTQPEQGIIYEYNKPASVTQQTVTQFGSKPIVQTQSGYTQSYNTQSQPQQGTIYQYNKPTSVNQQTVFPFGSKPIVQSQTGYGQTQSQQGTIYQYNKPTSVNQHVTQFGPKPIAQSQSSYSQSQTQPQQGTIYEYNKPTSQKETTSTVEQVTSGQAPFVSQGTQFGNQASNSFGSTSGQHSAVQQTQNQGTVFGSQSVEQSGQKGSQLGQNPFAGSQTGSTFQQSHFGTQGSQFGQNSGTQQNQGTIYEYNKPVSALTHTDSNSASSGSQFVQGTSSQSGVAQVQNTQSSNKPIGNSQTSSTYKPSEYDSHQANLFAQKVTESGYTQQPSGALPTSIPTRFGENPSSESSQTLQSGQQVVGSSQTGSNFQQSQLGSSFGQKQPTTQTQTTFGQQPTSSSQTGYGFQQTAFGTSGSKFGQKPQTVFTSGTSSKGPTGPTTQFGQQSSGSPSTSQIINPTGFQLGQNTQTVENTGLDTGVISQTTTSKPVGSSQTGSYFQQISQTPQTNQGSSLTITPSKGQSTQTSQFGQAQNVGSGFTQTQYGSGIKPQSGFGTVFTTKPQVQPISHYSIKPFGSQFSQYTFQKTPTTGFQFGQKLPSSAGSVFTTSQVQPNYQFTKKPFGSQSTQNTFQQTQFGSTTGSQVGQTNKAVSQTTSFGQKPAGGSVGVNTFSSTTQAPQFQGTQFGSSSGSQANKGSSFSIGTSQSGVKPFGSSQTPGSGYPQTQYGSSFASQNSQNTQPGFGTVSTVTPQVIPISQYGPKPSGSQYTQNTFTQNRYGYIGSRFGENQPTTGIVPVTTTSFVQKPVGVSQTATGYKQTQFGSSSSSVAPVKGQSVQTTEIGVKPFGSSQTAGSSLSQTQFGAFGVQKGQNSQSGVNAFSTSTQALLYQGSQFGSSLGSQANKGSTFSIGTISKGQTTQSGVKPFGSGYSQTQYGSSIGSHDSQNTQSGVGAVSTIPPQVQQISQYGQKPFASLNVFPQAQSVSSQFSQNQQTVDTVPLTTTTLVQQPKDVSQAGSGDQQTQIGSSSSSVANTGAVANQGQVVQTTQYGLKPSQNSGVSFTQSRFGSLEAQKVQNEQTGVGTISTTTQSPQYQGSQFGVSTGSQSGQTQFNQKPFGSTQNTGSSVQQTQTGSQFGSNFNVKPQATFGTQSSSSVFGQGSQSQFGSQVKKPYSSPFNTQFAVIGQKPQASASAFASSSPSFGSAQVGQVSKYQTTQFGTSGAQAANTFGSSQGVQGQTTQTSSQFGAQPQKPFGTSQFTYQPSQLTGIKKPEGSQSTFGGAQFGQLSKYQTTQFGTSGAQAANTFGSSQGVQGQTTQTSSQFGAQPQKPFGTSQFTYQPSQLTGIKKPEGSQSTFGGAQFGQVSKYQTTQFGTSGAQAANTFGGSQAVQGQTAQTSSQFGAQPQKPFGASQFTYQPSQLTGIKKPEGSQSTFGGAQVGQVSTQFGTSGAQAANTAGGSQTVQGQTTQTSSQFGAQPQKPFGTSQFTYQPYQLTGIKKPEGSQSTFQYGQSTPSTVNRFSLIPSKEQNAFSTVSRFGEQSKIEGQHTYQSTIAPLEYSTTYASTEGYGSSTPTSFITTTPQAYYYSSPLSVVGGTGSTPSSFVPTTNQVTSKPGVTVTTVQTPISGVLVNNQPAGFVEKFSSFRNPPSYNHVTGYHY